MTETPVLPRASHASPPPPASPWPRRAALIATAAIAAFVIWAVNVEPLVPGSGQRGAQSPTLELLAVDVGPGEGVYIAPWQEGAEVTVAFIIHNEGFVPVHVVDVAPEDEALGCGWRSNAVTYRRDLRSGETPQEPFEPFSLGPGASAAIRVTGHLTCPVGSDFSGLTWVGTVPVRFRILGIPRSQNFPLTFFLAWTADPAEWLEQAVHTVPSGP